MEAFTATTATTDAILALSSCENSNNNLHLSSPLYFLPATLATAQLITSAFVDRVFSIFGCCVDERQEQVHVDRTINYILIHGRSVFYLRVLR